MPTGPDSGLNCELSGLENVTLLVKVVVVMTGLYVDDKNVLVTTGLVNGVWVLLVVM